MKTRSAIAIIIVLASTFSVAQKFKAEPESDPVQEAIQKFKSRDKKKPNEVTVILDDVAPGPDLKKDDPADEESSEKAAVLVSGKPAEDADEEVSPDEDAVEAIAADPEENPEEDLEENPEEPEGGLAVRVENLHTGNGSIDPAKVKLLAPFPAKPLAQPPAGWHLDSSDSAPPFTREVEISPGSKITLTIRPHLLVPDADGVEAFSISEPGYDHTLGYQQSETVGAILSTSIRQLDEESKQLGNAIDRLQQLLVSLPAPETKPASNSK